MPITLSPRANIVDPIGQIFVLKEEEDAARANPDRRVPLAIRANAGEDCIDVVLKSELPDLRDNGFLSKVNVHIHFVQFDIQGSDGVNTGFNYEQSVRPFTIEGETLVADAPAGGTAVRLSNVERFQPGILVGVGMDQDSTFEIRRIKEVAGDALLFDEPLRHAHRRGEVVSTEFVRYRWFPDVQFGTAYFHDHVDALHSWRHGLFGALIAEPPGATYRHPRTGAEVRSGPIADIHTDAVVTADVKGSFREAVMFIQDDVRLTRVGESSGGALNLRAEPLAARGGDPAQLFNSAVHGDPATPVIEAFPGDPVVVRALVPGTNDVHTWHVDGHWFRIEPFSLTSPPVNTVHLGISERYDLAIPRAGGPQGRPGDYLYYNGRTYKLREGNWGILRVHDPATTSLRPLPGRQTTPRPPPDVCPVDAPRKRYAVAAIDAPLPMLRGMNGKRYVLQEDRDAVLAGAQAPEPLVLHVNVGDCVVIDLTNQTQGGPVSFQADLLAYDPAAMEAAAPGEQRTYVFYAHSELGEAVALVRDRGNVLENPAVGLYGAIIVGPRGAAYRHSVTGEDMSARAGWRVDVHPVDGPAYRDFALFIQDEDPIIGTAIMPYAEQVQGVVGLNYQAEPLAARRARNRDGARLFMSGVHGDPATPVLEANVGDGVRIHALVPVGEQAHVFSVEGHQWPLEPGRDGSTRMSSTHLGPLEAITLILDHGAGGRDALAGDYLYGDHREPYRDAGLWGIFRVRPSAADSGLLPLPSQILPMSASAQSGSAME